VADGLAPADLVERIERISTAAHELRRDCINMLLGVGTATPEQVRANAEKALAEAQADTGAGTE